MAGLIPVDVPSGRVWVEPEHRGRLEAALASRERWKIPFVIALSCSVVLVVAGKALEHRWLEDLGVSLIGATVVALPLTTPATTRALGIVRARRLGRALGALILTMGLLSLLRR